MSNNSTKQLSFANTVSKSIHSPHKKLRSISHNLKKNNNSISTSLPYFKVIPADMESRIPVKDQPFPVNEEEEEKKKKQKEKKKTDKNKMGDILDEEKIRRKLYEKDIKQGFNYQNKLIQHMRQRTGMMSSLQSIKEQKQKQKIPAFNSHQSNREGLPPLQEYLLALKISPPKKNYEFGPMGVGNDKYDIEKDYDPLTNRQYIHLRPVKKRSISNINQTVNNGQILRGNYNFKQTQAMADEQKKLKKLQQETGDKNIEFNDVWGDSFAQFRAQRKFTIKNHSRLLKETESALIRSKSQKEKFTKGPMSLAQQARLEREDNENENEDNSQINISQYFETGSPSKSKQQFTGSIKDKQYINGYKVPYQAKQSYVIYQTQEEYDKIQKIKLKKQSPSKNQTYQDILKQQNQSEHFKKEKKLTGLEQKKLSEIQKMINEEKEKQQKQKESNKELNDIISIIKHQPVDEGGEIKDKNNQKKEGIKEKILQLLDSKQNIALIFKKIAGCFIISEFLSPKFQILQKDNLINNIQQLQDLILEFDQFAYESTDCLYLITNALFSVSELLIQREPDNMLQFKDRLEAAIECYENNSLVTLQECYSFLPYIRCKYIVSFILLQQYSDVQNDQVQNENNQEHQDQENSLTMVINSEQQEIEKQIIQISKNMAQNLIKLKKFYTFYAKSENKIIFNQNIINNVIINEDIHCQDQSLTFEEQILKFLKGDIMNLQKCKSEKIQNCKAQIVQNGLEYAQKYNLEQVATDFRKFL